MNEMNSDSNALRKVQRYQSMNEMNSDSLVIPQANAMRDLHQQENTLTSKKPDPVSRSLRSRYGMTSRYSEPRTPMRGLERRTRMSVRPYCVAMPLK
jgi:hypothetical protein